MSKILFNAMVAGFVAIMMLCAAPVTGSHAAFAQEATSGQDEDPLEKWRRKKEEREMEQETQAPENPGMGLQFKRIENSSKNDVENDSDLSEEELEAKKEAERVKRQQRLHERAFEATRNGLFPLRPDEIEQMLDVYNTTRFVGETSGRAIPTPMVKVASISLDPSVRPEVIKTSPGHVTSITVLDVSGQPWPIQDVSWAGEFEVMPPEDDGHVIRVTPMSAHGIGNMSVRLIDLPTPVTFTLQTGGDEVYYRFDARIPEYGPNGVVPLIRSNSGLMAGNALMTSVLDGTPPADALRLSVTGVDARTSVWKTGGQIFVRTPYSLLSPGWQSSASSSDGMKVYTIAPSPVLLLSDKGTLMRAFIGKEEIVDDDE